VRAGGVRGGGAHRRAGGGEVDRGALRGAAPGRLEVTGAGVDDGDDGAVAGRAGRGRERAAGREERRREGERAEGGFEEEAVHVESPSSGQASRLRRRLGREAGPGW